MSRPSRRLASARRRSTRRLAPRWSRFHPAAATSTTRTRPVPRISTRSSSGRHRLPSAVTARTPACLTPNGSQPGRRSRASLSVGESVARPRPKGGGAAPLQALFWRRPWLRPLALLTPPLAWILILNHSGVLNWSLQSIGLPPANIGYTNTAMWVVFSYIWLPFMIIPVYAALERVPESLIEAAAALGARRWRTLRDVIL